MARSGQQAQASAQPQGTVSTSQKVDVNALREQQKAIAAQLKAVKAQVDGQVSAVDFTPDGGTMQLDIALGDGSRRTTDGRAYLFAADGVEFTRNGVTYQLSAIYATAKRTK